MAYTTIDDPSAYFQSKVYTGNDSDNSITNGGNSNLQADFIWIKRRDYNNAHVLLDSTKGVTKILQSNDPVAEVTLADRLDSFDSDGFTVTSTSGAFNADGEPFIAWQWKANGGSTSSVSASGAMNAGTYQANTTAGFSVITYTGEDNVNDTVTHGLGAVPHLMLVKNRDNAADWAVYHHKNTSAPETDRLLLSTNAATVDDSTYWSDTVPTSSVFTVGTDIDTGDADAYTAYLWTEIQGYSKFGSYTGNGNADGTFIYTGFTPALVIMKNTADNTSWWMIDSARSTYNPSILNLAADDPEEEGTGASMGIDILSNGFKQRSTTTTTSNRDGHKYVYAAWAENPFVTSGGIPATAS